MELHQTIFSFEYNDYFGVNSITHWYSLTVQSALVGDYFVRVLKSLWSKITTRSSIFSALVLSRGGWKLFKHHSVKFNFNRELEVTIKETQWSSFRYEIPVSFKILLVLLFFSRLFSVLCIYIKEWPSLSYSK